MYLVSVDTATGRVNRYATQPRQKPLPDGVAQITDLSRVTEDAVQIFRKTGNVA